MKALWIVLSFLFACGFLCFGGLFLYGRNVLVSTRRLDREAEAYSRDTFLAVSRDWDVSELRRRLDESVPPGGAENMIRSAAGSVRPNQPPVFTTVQTSLRTFGAERFVVVKDVAQTPVKGGKPASAITIEAVRRPDGWHVLDFRFGAAKSS